MWSPVGVGPDECGVRDNLEQSPLELVAQCTEFGRSFVDFVDGQLHGPAQPHDPGNIFRPRSDAELLAPAVNDRLHCIAVAYDERTNPLWCADLVPGDRQQRARKVVEPAGDLAHGLDRIGVERRSCVLAALGERSDILDDADLVVHPHGAEYRQSSLQCLVHRRDIHLAPSVDG